MPLQNHIHLAETLGGTPENAPVEKWVIVDRLPVPQIFMSLRRSVNGKLRKHRLKRNGDIVQLVNFRYTIRVSATATETLEERVDKLLALNGKNVYLCDSFHANNGSDHTPDVRPMVVANLGDFPPIGPGLQYFNVDIELEDDSL